jgi:hypothetical protein
VLCGLLDPIGKREESIGRNRRAFERQHRLHRSHLDRIDAAHLPSSRTHTLASPRIHDRVRLDVLANLPAEFERSPFFFAGDALGNHLALAPLQPVRVGRLHQVSAADRFHHRLVGGSWTYLQQAQVLLRRQYVSCARGIIGRSDGFDERFRDLLRGLFIQRPIERQNSTVSRDGIRLKRAPVALGLRRRLRAATRIGVLDDGRRRLIKLVNQLPGRVEIDQIVVRELLALQLLGSRDSTVPYGIKRRRLMRILPIA